ncbi:MAG: hypothetical protein MUD12_09860 [Spirochaetes bacterium]|jgi:general secretion pathway protein D|nr:hypothetical protein [Spirochaetota bacterium]
MNFSKNKKISAFAILILLTQINMFGTDIISQKTASAQDPKDKEKTPEPVKKEAVKEIEKNININKEAKERKNGKAQKNGKNPKNAKDAKESKAAQKPQTQPQKEKMFALNFKDVEIEEFLNIMSQLIGKNIIMDDKIKGKISIISSKKVPVNQAYSIMKSILEIKGIAVIEVGNLIKVIPMKDAIKKNSDVIVDDKTGEMTFGIDQTMTYLLELKNSYADEIATALVPLKSQFTDVVIYRPLNTLIISGNSSEIDGLVKIAKSLDRLGKMGQKIESAGNIHVLHLENANAEELANVLSRVPFSQNAKIMSGQATTSPQPSMPPAGIQPSSAAQRVTQTQTSGADKTPLSIIANKATNSLIITALPDEYSEIKRIIKELDIVREQVLIESMIVEVNADYGWEFGVDWLLGGSLTGKEKWGTSQINGPIPKYSLPEGDYFKPKEYTFGDIKYTQQKKLAVPLQKGFQLGLLHDADFVGFAIIHASATDNNVNVLSTPQIVTVDNQEAELNVGEEVPITRDNRLAADGTSFQTFDYKPVGIKLKFTPHITNNKKITIDFYQEVNSVIGSETITTAGSYIPPKLGKRDIKTKISIFDGQTIVVGGLMKNNKSTTEEKIPLLGDIPLLGWLFKYRKESTTKVNLLVFLTPHILTKQETIDSITKQKRNSIKRLRQETKEK